MSDRRIVKSAEARNLPAVLAFIEESCRELDLDPSGCFALKLAVEEVFMNLIDHGYAEGEDPWVEIVAQGSTGGVRIDVRDHARAFDPSEAPVADLTSDWEQRRIGGLGWHLIHELMDEVSYTSNQGENCLTLIKRAASDPSGPPGGAGAIPS